MIALSVPPSEMARESRLRRECATDRQQRHAYERKPTAVTGAEWPK
jgi:hypothetical protein